MIIALTFLVLVLILLLAAFIVRKKLASQGDAPETESQVAKKKPVTKAQIFPPNTFFPDQWREGVDQEKLTNYLDQAKRNTVNEYFTALGVTLAPLVRAHPPAPEVMVSASERAAQSVNRTLTDPAFFPLLTGGQELTQAQAGLLVLHLNELLPPLRLPPPTIDSGTAKPWAIALVGMIGAGLGNLFGGALIQYLGQPLETGALVGGALGAALGILMSLYLVQNEKIRRIVLAAVGGMAVIDILLSIFKGSFLPSFLTSKSTIWKRLFFYAGMLVILFLVKGDKVFDPKLHRQALEQKIDDYLKSNIALILVLLHRLQEQPETPTETPQDIVPVEISLVEKVTSIVQRLRNKESFEQDPAFQELIRKLANAGYETKILKATSEQRLIVWEEQMSSDYKTFGLVRPGQTLVIEEEPVRKDGQIIRKGLVVPK
jgi:hypothetical protein